MKKINLDSWIRKEHFQHYSKYDEPFFGIVSQIDCTQAYKRSKQEKISFFAYYLHNSLLALNQIEEFKTRILNNEVILYDQIHSSATIGREDGTFGISFVEFQEDFYKFESSFKKESDAVRNTSGLGLSENEARLDLIHYSSLPWTTFTGLSHARDFKSQDSVPKIVFGKYYAQNEKKIMAVSIHIHHGLADGIHVARFLEIFQELMNVK